MNRFPMQSVGGGHGRRGRLLWPVLLAGAVLLLVLGERWKRRGERPALPARGTVARPGASDAGPGPDEGAAHASGHLVPPTIEARAEGPPDRSRTSSGFTLGRLVQVLDSWSSGNEPDVDALERFVERMAHEVRVTACRRVPSDDPEAMEGTVAIETLGLEGTFSRRRDELRVDFLDPGDERAAAFRDFMVWVSVGRRGVLAGGIYVHQHHDVRAQGVLDSFGPDPRIVGWNLHTFAVAGTKLTPITVVRNWAGLKVSPDPDPAAALRREEDRSLDRYRAWWSAFDDLEGER